VNGDGSTLGGGDGVIQFGAGPGGGADVNPSAEAGGTAAGASARLDTGAASA
jgi:hypothetical protein